MNESTEQKSGKNDPKIEAEKIVTPVSNPQSPAKPADKCDPKTAAPSHNAVPPHKADSSVKTAPK
jgi:hypothetical protein